MTITFSRELLVVVGVIAALTAAAVALLHLVKDPPSFWRAGRAALVCAGCAALVAFAGRG